MDHREIPLQLPVALLSAAVVAALEQDVTLGHYLRDLIRRDLARRNRAAHPAGCSDAAFIAALRSRLAGDLAFSTGWDELQARLNDKGYTLRDAGSGVALHVSPGGARVCTASELGVSYGRLMRRFGAPLPGHARSWQTGRPRAMAGANDTDTDTDTDTDKFDVIENDTPLSGLPGIVRRPGPVAAHTGGVR